MDEHSDFQRLRQLAAIAVNFDKNRSYSDEEIAGLLRYWPTLAPDVARLRYLSDDWKRTLVRDYPGSHQRLAERNKLPEDVVCVLRRSTDPSVQSALSSRDEHAVRRGTLSLGTFRVAEPGSDLDARSKSRERWLYVAFPAVLARATDEGLSVERHVPALDSGPFVVRFDGNSVHGFVELWPVGVARCLVARDDGDTLVEWSMCVEDASGLTTLSNSVLALVLEAGESCD